MVKSTIILFLLICLSFSERTDKTKHSKQLIIGFVPSEEAERMIKNLDPATNYLSKKLNLTVNIYKGTDYKAIIEAMRGEKLDIAISGPFSYVLSSRKAGAEPLAIPAARMGDMATHNSLIINKNTEITSIEQLMIKSNVLYFSFSDPASASRQLIQKGYLISLGIEPETHFKNTLFSGSHTATVVAFSTGKNDVVGCLHPVCKNTIESNMLNREEIALLWKSIDMSVDLVTTRKGISTELKTKIRDACAAVSGETPGTAGYFYGEWNDFSLVHIAENDQMNAEIKRLTNYI